MTCDAAGLKPARNRADVSCGCTGRGPGGQDRQAAVFVFLASLVNGFSESQKPARSIHCSQQCSATYTCGQTTPSQTTACTPRSSFFRRHKLAPPHPHPFHLPENKGGMLPKASPANRRRDRQLSKAVFVFLASLVNGFSESQKPARFGDTNVLIFPAQISPDLNFTRTFFAIPPRPFSIDAHNPVVVGCAFAAEGSVTQRTIPKPR